MSDNLAFSDFRLAKFILEIRYKPAYLLWDNSGQIWYQVKTIWPDIEVQTADPNKTFFKLGDDISLTVELEKAFVIFHRKKIKDSLPILEKFFHVLLDGLVKSPRPI
nr:hypothetical protein [uncultured Desulfobacter sp.]